MRACFVLVCAARCASGWQLFSCSERAARGRNRASDRPAEPPEAPATPSPSTEPPPGRHATGELAARAEAGRATDRAGRRTAATRPIAPAASAPQVKEDPDNGFRFGSYGRVLAGDRSARRQARRDRDRRARHRAIVEPSYLELDTSYGFTTEQGLKLRPVITLAFDGTLFHDTGEFDAHPALRNMYPRRSDHARAERVGRLADVPRRRYLPARLLAARRPEHRRRRRVLAPSDRERRRRARGRTAAQPPERSVPVPGDRGREPRPGRDHGRSSSTASA